MRLIDADKLIHHFEENEHHDLSDYMSLRCFIEVLKDVATATQWVSISNDTVLQRFKRFKSMVVPVNIPSNLLLEILESYITSDDEPAVEEIPVLDGQLSLFDEAV